MHALVIPDPVLSGIIQVVIALLASGLLIQVFLLRQNRRKIAGEATAQEANAASTLSGAALQMVESAQRTAHEAEKRAGHAADAAEKCREENNRLWQELNRARWEIHWLQIREKVLERALQQSNVIVPQSPERAGEVPDEPPPPVALPPYDPSTPEDN